MLVQVRRRPGSGIPKGLSLPGILTVSFFAAACDTQTTSPPDAWQSVIETLGDTTAALVGVGEFDERLGGVAFGSVQSGTISPGGEWFAVGDRDPPFISVFRADGTVISSFLKRGEGPSESNAYHHYRLGGLGHDAPSPRGQPTTSVHHRRAGIGPHSPGCAGVSHPGNGPRVRRCSLPVGKSP